MWLLKRLGLDYILPCNKDILVGRKDVDIVIIGDSSVSRKHAILRITQEAGNLKNPDAIPTLTLADSSKFGTFVRRSGNEKKQVEGTTILRTGDNIHFGAQDSIYEVEYVPLVITTSMLGNDTKQSLQEALMHIGGHMVSNWHEKVTHFVIEKIKLNIKMTLALVNACHVVTPGFVYKLKSVIGIASSEVKPEEYIPELAEPSLSQKLCSFQANTKRKTIFNNRTFIHMSKRQQKRLGPTISCGGGKSIAADDESINDNILLNSLTAVVACSETERESLVMDTTQYEHIREVLLINGHRIIEEHEIGLAVLYCNASVYCNPAIEKNSQNVFTQQAAVESKSGSSTDTNKQSREALLGSTTPGHCGLKKRSRTPDVGCTEISSCSTGKKPKECHESETISKNALIQQKVPNDEAPDSCLDDDGLWSQSLSSMSHTHRENAVNTSLGRQSKLEGIRNRFVDLGSEHKQSLSLGNSDEVKVESVDSMEPYVKSEMVSPSPTKQSSETLKESVPVLQSNVKSLPKSQSKTESYDSTLPTHLAQIDVCNLVANKKRIKVVEFTNTTEVENFKRFSKIWPTYMAKHMSNAENIFSHPPIPHIIGGSDFFVNEDRHKGDDVMDLFGQESQQSNPFSEISKFGCKA